MNALAAEILKDDQNLLSRLNFFILKSNECKVLTSALGNIFVTTGLISQLETESDLAFVLSVEIARYKLQHGLTLPDNYYGGSEVLKPFRSLQNYSKKQILDADSLGLDIYLEAGYSKARVPITLDILYYSYLPTDEVTVTPEKIIGKGVPFNSDLIPEDKVTITFSEEFEDDNRSFSNIEDRKEKLMKRKVTRSEDGGNSHVQLLPEESFSYIRKIARFERVQNALYAGKYGKALYEVMVLEENHPQSKYLKLKKALSWTNLAINSSFEKPDFSLFDMGPNTQGSIYELQFFLQKCSKKERVSYALRQVEVCLQEYPYEPSLLQMEKVLFAILIGENIRLDEYSEYTKEEVAKNNKRLSVFEKEVDDLTILHYGYSQEEWEALDKYTKIKVKKESKSNKLLQKVDLNPLYTYKFSLVGVLNEEMKRRNKRFLEDYEEPKDVYRADAFSTLSEQKRVYQNNLGDSLVLYADPLAVYRGNKGKKVNKSMIKTSNMRFGFSTYAKSEDCLVGDYSKYGTALTDDYNKNAAITRYSVVRQQMEAPFYINPDFDFFDTLDYHSNLLLMADAEGRSNVHVYFLEVLYSVSLYGVPIIPLAMYKTLRSNHTKLHFVVYDLRTGGVVKEANYVYLKGINAPSVALYLNDFLKN
ncbi:hypothetical protein [Lishizhenia sp.]|uniref:hypothetical protein n=1 Tax=Lishizhenia sp. TaxID=2497594 RepID=UPI00299F2CF9|nr:hypothetical protein [Lishizhenia sp.]MDX1445601.1 hypothetical protein [Lishizhenia sp.]